MKEPDVQQIFGERLRLLREAHAYTQKDIAQKLNVSRSTYTRYENGSSAPSLELTRQLVQILADGDPRFLMQLPETDGTPTLSAEEKQLILLFRALDDSQKQTLLETLKTAETE